MMQNFNVHRWVKISLAHLFVVAVIGVLMRYKIGFSLPYLDQKNLQHAHSHFAFAGWITQIIMAFMVSHLQASLDPKRQKTYHFLILTNMICAWGMLISFAVQGYAFFSISFSTASILISFLYAFFYYHDLSFCTQSITQKWFRAALLFNILSSVGTFFLVYMMTSNNLEQHNYLASVYWYLHFQYNGWFFFACMGLLHSYLLRLNPAFTGSANVFWLFACSCIPAYGLSVLWLKLPLWLMLVIALAGIIQFLAWVKFLWIFRVNRAGFSKKMDWLMKFLLVVAACSATIKMSLQLGSTIPAVSKLAFGFRPIVIAYLHLVLLALTSIFLLSYAYGLGFIKSSKFSIVGFLIFVMGVFANELVLAIQGIASFSYTVIPYANEMLFAMAFIMTIGLLILLLAQNMRNIINP